MRRKNYPKNHADPTPVEPEMGKRVYAGPEYFAAKRPTVVPKDAEEPTPPALQKTNRFNGVYAGPEFFRSARHAPIQAVYAGPEFFNPQSAQPIPGMTGPVPAAEKSDEAPADAQTKRWCVCCGSPISESAKFCKECGTPQPRKTDSGSYCPRCGAELVVQGIKYCPECGAPQPRDDA